MPSLLGRIDFPSVTLSKQKNTLSKNRGDEHTFTHGHQGVCLRTSDTSGLVSPPYAGQG